MYHNKKAYCTIVIIAVNILVFVVLSFWGATEDGEYMLQHGAMYLPLVLQDGQYYRLFTSMFLHFGIAHLLNNMLTLAILGWTLENEIGRIKYLIIYFVGGLGGNALSLFMDFRSQDYVVSAGASGAIFAVVGALVYLAICNRGRIGNMTGRGLLLMCAITLYNGFTTTGIDNMAHIGGGITGFLLALVLYHKRQDPRQDENSYYM